MDQRITKDHVASWLKLVAAVKDRKNMDIKMLRIHKYRCLTLVSLQAARTFVEQHFAQDGRGELIE